LTNTHALIIDDNSLNIEILVKLLSIQGISHSAVTSPMDIDSALDATDQVDVVFLDLEIPNYDGFEILGTLKADERIQGAPVVAYTVHTSEIDVAREAGFDGFLGKPLDAKRFPGQLERILSGRKVWEI
jgi:two-component system, cell cycle response regulator DivK